MSQAAGSTPKRSLPQVAQSKDGGKGKKSGDGKAARGKKPSDGEIGPVRRVFIQLARVAALLIVFGAVPFLLCYSSGPRWFWTLTIAVLPLFIVAIGYYSWRHVCPLAQTAQLGRALGIGGKRKTGKFLEANYALVQLGILWLCLTLRLTAINGDPLVLGLFLVAVFAISMLVGLIYTGKTWCNFFCPVGVVERMYTEPQSLAPQSNSQCQTCTACKKFCPDIDLEQGYWKDAELGAKTLASYAFPGLVFGFYFYYYLAAGNWTYYFSGVWTREPGAWRHWDTPGFYFAPSIPRVVAAPLTLLVCAAVPALVLVIFEKLQVRWYANSQGETSKPEDLVGAGKRAVKKLLVGLAADIDQAKWKNLARHRTLSLAAFLAFNCFYVFAGAPTLGRWPVLYRVFQFLVILLSTMFLSKRWRRREEDFVQEKFARGFLKRWEWGDEPPPTDLKDLYLLHTERQKQRADRVRAYKDTVRDMLKDGVVAREELYLLGKLRSQLGISEPDHEKVLAELGVEDKSLFDPSKQHSAEKRLQLEGYRRSVERMIIDRAPQGGRLDARELESLRAEYKLSKEEAEGILSELRDSRGPIVARIKSELDELEALASQHQALAGDDGHSRSLDFMRFLVRWRQDERIERVLGLLGSIYDERPVAAVREQLEASDPAVRAGAVAAIAKCGDPALTERLARVVGARLEAEPTKSTGPRLDAPSTAPQTFTHAADAVRLAALTTLAKDASPFVRACAAFVLSRYDEGPAIELTRAATDDESVIVRETAVRSLGVRGRLGRELMEKALRDKDPIVHRAALRASSRTTAEIQLLPEGVMQSMAGNISGQFRANLAQSLPPGSGGGSGAGAGAGAEETPPMFATLDPRAPVESLTTLEKMMLLRNVGLFDDLPPEGLLEVTRISQERRFLAGQVICREGDVGNEAYLIISGKVRVWLSRNGQTQVLSEMGAGMCIGEMAVLDHAPRSANITAVADVRALSIPGDGFRVLTLERPELSRNIIAALTSRLRGMIAAQFGKSQPQPPQQQ